jgi:hypothetical protein
MKLDKRLPLKLRQMIRIEGGCWHAYNNKGYQTKLFWNFDTELSTPIATFVYRACVGPCEPGARFVRTCGDDDCVNPEHMELATLAARLDRYTNRRGPNECWPWTGATNSDGYGVLFGKSGNTVYAHRAAYEQANGAIPDGLLVRHLCNNPLCCNPAHLATGTAADNAADSVAAGVSKRMGRRAGDTERTAAAVQAVRAGMKIIDAARAHGVTRVTIWRNMRVNK